MVRRDLSPGAQACQAAHALREFAATYPVLEQAWFEDSNTVVILTCSDLEDLEARAAAAGEPCVRFVEPDWHPDGELTALALGPGARRLLSSLPLMR